MTKKVLAFGELLWDLFPDGPVLGGAPSNFACRLQALGCDVSLVSRVGCDERGREALSRIAGLGLDTRFIQSDPDHPTGVVEVTVKPGGFPDYRIAVDTAYDGIEPSPELLKLAARMDAICFGTLAQRSPRSRRTLQDLLSAAPGALKFFDVNFRQNFYSLDSLAESLDQTDLLKVNEDEARVLLSLFGLAPSGLPEAAACFVRRWELTACVVTLGDRGALAVGREGEAVYEPGYKVSLVDSCGAGDAFSAGFLHEFMAGRNLDRCCALGNALGAIVSTQKGATEPVAWEGIAALIEGSNPRVNDADLAPLRSGADVKS
jgi:fructokinase